MPKRDFQSVEEYLAAQPETTRQALQHVRRAIQKAIPKAEEVITYQMPTYKVNGAAVIYFAGWKAHYSLYPASARLVDEFKDELLPYEVRKGTIRFPLSEPVPRDLIERIARFRAGETA